ncbi:NAD(P) transhydrogenase subunit beta [Halolactibacillus alkaliphilus]|uniref:NAD(P) transhydrogenase subunit beta n=2 Tax=Halolactibacillus alkaliphilus TaxID=442899 RepID=A0A511WWQ2_9BACI|nr:NAD(P)(+) transhydrogenase (Re/Si-specific) subunit beta [Halolactibacillus alkaliphilus]GEN55554.1 NAD(P) transhydrogenase subunit beta [Halolactibacillus alkaliphilus]GGN64053.1 NAD(P) transhydrogenase subunit beta [Halolactibacillus alkaliphilus]
MMNETVINGLYIVSAIFFVFGLKMLGKAEQARKGNLISAIGMLIAIVTALISQSVLEWQWIAVGMIAGSIVGALAARLVAMTAMPEMVALFNGFGGAASLLVGWSEYHRYTVTNTYMEANVLSLLIIILTIVIGGATFTGSIVAWGKLSEKIPSKAIQYPGQQFVNVLIAASLIGAAMLFGPLRESLNVDSYILVIVTIVIACILGITFVIPIGGGDMPVVISLLNSFSGMAACAAGFVISNNVLIVAGALVGSSGIILTNIMCKSMNRKLTNVLFSGFGATKASTGGGFQGEAKPVSVEDAYLMLEAASNVLVVPGYGMAVAQAQHAIQELAAQLEENGAEVNFAVHPVAGRMPGHMNVLLAEANVPYEQLKEMEDVNPTIENVDIVIVIGANDVVNPAARTDETSPIYGMPIIDVDKARTVIVMKRSMNPGFAGIDNPLFFNDNTRMLFGDAKKSTQGLVAEFKG